MKNEILDNMVKKQAQLCERCLKNDGEMLCDGAKLLSKETTNKLYTRTKYYREKCIKLISKQKRESLKDRHERSWCMQNVEVKKYFDLSFGDFGYYIFNVDNIKKVQSTAKVGIEDGLKIRYIYPDHFIQNYVGQFSEMYSDVVEYPDLLIVDNIETLEGNFWKKQELLRNITIRIASGKPTLISVTDFNNAKKVIPEIEKAVEVKV